MNRRVLLAALAVALVLPGPAAAQVVPMADEPFWNARLRVTPFLGYMTSFTRAEEWTHTGTTPQFAQIDTEVAGGGVVGLNFDVPVASRVGLTGMAAYASRNETLFRVLETDDIYRIDGSNFLIGRLGAALHLREAVSELVLRRLGASVWAGAVVMHERPRNSLSTGGFLENATHFGANFGFSGELPFANDRMALQIAAEDNLMWWSDSNALAYEFFGRPGTPEETTVSTDMTHAWLFRLGVSFRMQ
jgi:hypothetical protein